MDFRTSKRFSSIHIIINSSLYHHRGIPLEGYLQMELFLLLMGVTSCSASKRLVHSYAKYCGRSFL